MKNLSILILSLFIGFNSYGQACNAYLSGFTGKQVPVVGLIQLVPSIDTLCWYWNREEVMALYPSQFTSVLGTPSSSTFLRGDNTWAVPSGGASSELPAITSVNSIPAVGNGIPVIVAQANLRAQTTALDVLDYTPIADNKTYRLDFSGYATSTRISTAVLTYTDENGASASVTMPVLSSATSYLTSVAGNWGNAGVRFFGQSFIFTATTATHIKLSTTVAGSPNYDIDAVLTRLN